MNLNSDSSIAEFRNELERKRKKAQELQMNTTDADEWGGLNTLRWELEDLDKDIYLSQFIKNNDMIAKLVGEIQGASTNAQKLIKSIEEVEKAIKVVREKLQESSSMFGEISGFLDEVESTMQVMSV